MWRHVRLLLVVTLTACSFGGGDDEDGEKWKKRPTPVTVVETLEVARGDVSDLLLASAVVEAEASADLMPVASGMALAVYKDVGDPVRKGDVLARIDNAQLDAGAERAEAEVAHLQARVAEMQRLSEAGAVSSRELEDLRYQLATAQTSLREARKSAGETRITAPFDGVVAARDIKVGELASSARRAFQVVDLSELRVRASLPERDVSRVAIGQHARLVSAYDPELTGDATITRISPVIDATNGTFQVTLTLSHDATRLRPGQYVSVQLEVDRHSDVLVIPKDAVVYENGAPTAFVVIDAPPEPAADPDADEVAQDGEDAKGEADADKPGEGEGADEEPAGPKLVAHKVELELGLTDTLNAEVLHGLAAGDQLIVIGQSNLRDGARVRLPKTTPDAAASPPADGSDAPDDEG